MIFGFGLLDWLLVLIAVAAAVVGYRQGLVVGLLSLVGFVGGAILGVVLVPKIVSGLDSGLWVAMLAIALLLGAAFGGQALLGWVGVRLRERVSSREGQHLDSFGGAALAIAGSLIAAWALGLAVVSAGLPVVSDLVRQSVVLRSVNEFIPQEAPQRISRAFGSLVESNGFPRVVAPFVEEPIVAVPPPSPDLTSDPEVRRAAGSVVKVIGRAQSCDRVLEGSGFVVAKNRILTNAHVVAGVREPTVLVPGGDRLSAKVVVFDPDTDVAILAVSGLRRPVLPFEDEVNSGDDAVVLGYPNNGPLSSTGARVRGEQVLLGEDIYGERRVERQVISVRSDVRPGNSGGPLVSPEGEVYGVVFAASLSDGQTGYALSPEAVAPAVKAGTSAAERVSTGRCT